MYYTLKKLKRKQPLKKEDFRVASDKCGCYNLPLTPPGNSKWGVQDVVQCSYPGEPSETWQCSSHSHRQVQLPGIAPNPGIRKEHLLAVRKLPPALYSEPQPPVPQSCWRRMTLHEPHDTWHIVCTQQLFVKPPVNDIGWDIMYLWKSRSSTNFQ